MNFNENDLWRDKTKLLNLRFSKLNYRAKVLLKLEFDTEDKVLFSCIVLLILNCLFGYFETFGASLMTGES